MLPSSPDVANGIELFPTRWEGLHYLVDHCAFSRTLTLVNQKQPLLVFLVIFSQNAHFQMSRKWTRRCYFYISWLSEGLPQGIALLGAKGPHLEGFEHISSGPWGLHDWPIPLKILAPCADHFSCWVHLFDFGKFSERTLDKGIFQDKIMGQSRLLRCPPIDPNLASNTHQQGHILMLPLNPAVSECIEQSQAQTVSRGDQPFTLTRY